MSDYEGARVIYLLAALVLVGSGLWGTRLSLGKSLRLLLLWAGIFLIAFLLVDNRHAIGRAFGILPAEAEQQDVQPNDNSRIADVMREQGRA
ncbi:hypothetical protein P1X14_01615 [Sphingomonas sp. AOB5]|uniref:hypothetical protein n=1 Tax=Sphingomonas sp. AOB5 TaxID=3034017 RepID=UPI0023F68098|nr:hypothetical protein [Sphingomonas sp. AOB5]MDF7773930.1 hypothetical protein [Sphingomonas sp. AOB5]